MAFTNAELVRIEAGDSGVPVRDVASGDGTTTTFYISSYPIIGGSQVIKVGGVTVAETTDYTIDDETGEIVFTSPPAYGTDNIVVVYRGVQIKDTAITEACRQFGLTDSAIAEPGPAAPVLSAAAMVCNWKASEYANEFDFDTDGQSFKRGALAKQWSDRAAALQQRAMKHSGIVSIQSVKIDGYASQGEFASRDYDQSAQSPRRRYYGQPDRIP